MRGVYAKKTVYESVIGWDSFEPALSLAEEFEPDGLSECAQGIPDEWHGFDTAGLQQLTEALHQRRSKIRRLIESFRSTAGLPFPNWTRHCSIACGKRTEVPAQAVQR